MTEKPKDPEGILLYGIEDLVKVIDGEIQGFDNLVKNRRDKEAYNQGIGALDMANMVNGKIVSILLAYNEAAKKRERSKP